MKLCLCALGASLAIISTDVSAAAMDPGHDAPVPGSPHGVTPALAEISPEQILSAIPLMGSEIAIGHNIIAFCDNFMHVLRLSQDAAVRDAACAAIRIVTTQELTRLHEHFKIILEFIEKFNERKKREMTVFGSSELYAYALQIVAEQCSCGPVYRAEEILSFLLLARRMAEAFSQSPSPKEIVKIKKLLHAGASHAERIGGEPREMTAEEIALQDNLEDNLARMIWSNDLIRKTEGLGTIPSEDWRIWIIEKFKSLLPKRS